jgi:hypothetical protein
MYSKAVVPLQQPYDGLSTQRPPLLVPPHHTTTTGREVHESQWMLSSLFYVTYCPSHRTRFARIGRESWTRGPLLLANAESDLEQPNATP